MQLRHQLLVVLLAGGSSLLGTLPSQALERNEVSVAQLRGKGWQAQQLKISLRLGATPLQGQIIIARAKLQGLAQPVQDLVIDCSDVQLQADQFSCAKARISGKFPYLGPQRFTGTARYTRNTGAIAISVRELTLAKGQAQLQARLDSAGWQAEATTQHVDLAALLKLAATASLKTNISGTGSVNASLSARGVATRPQQLQWQVQVHQATLNNSAGTLASSDLTLRSSGSARVLQAGWQIDTQLDTAMGQVYAEPVFVDFAKQPFSASLQGQWDGARQLRLQQLKIDQQDVIAATARGVLQLHADNPAPELAVQLAQLKFPGSFATYAQPFLLDGSFKHLNTSGALQGELQIRASAPTSVDLRLQALHADDGSANLRFDQVTGDLHWSSTLRAGERPARSTISWRSGSLLGVELGVTQLPLEIWSSNLRIAEPTRIPVFDGALAIDAFRIRKFGTPQMAFMLDAVIEPIHVAKISRAFDWPEFGGELSGKITKLRMENDVLTLGASLNAQVFAGELTIGNMRLEGALSAWPRFNADIVIQNVNLEQVTQAFSFGRITGRLSGEINDLTLFNWQPTSFDARLYTPADDRSQHRISQRAVQNIGSVGGAGGGVTAALQSGFLRFFDDFNYDQLGLNCKLVNEVCWMNGIAPAKEGGYYLVRGKGLPRIDVIGNGTRVDWPRFVAQLKAVTESQGAVVK